MRKTKQNEQKPVDESVKPDPVHVENLGPFRLKDQEGGGISIGNGTDNFMVLYKINIRKVPGQNNRIEVQLVMPEPETVDVVKREVKI